MAVGGAMVIDDHLEHLRLCGYSQATIGARRGALLRLAAWLEAQEDPAGTARSYRTPRCRAQPPGRATAPETRLLHATPAELGAWRAGLRVTDEAVVTYVSHVRGFYRWAVVVGLCPVSPAAAVPVPRTGRRIPRPVSEADLLAALHAAPPRIRPWLVLAAWAGLRAKEIALLRVECILFSAQPPVLLIAEDATKGRRGRLVPMSAFAAAEMQAAQLPRAGYAFTRHDGQHGPNAPWLISHLANAHLHECGVAATLHQLRHRFGTQAYRASRDLLAVRDMMGHANSSTTQGYADYDSPVAVAAVEAIPAPARLRKVAG